MTVWMLGDMTSLIHYNDVIMFALASQITSRVILFTQPFIQAHMKEHIKAPRHWALCGEFTGPVTRKMFPFDDIIIFHTGGFNQTTNARRRVILLLLWRRACINVLCMLITVPVSDLTHRWCHKQHNDFESSPQISLQICVILEPCLKHADIKGGKLRVMCKSSRTHLDNN